AVVLFDIRDIGELDAQPALLGFRDVAAGGVLEVPEIAPERDLLLVGHRLVVEHQHRVAVHAGLDPGHLLAPEPAGQFGPRDLADENGVNLADAQRHCTSFLKLRASASVRTIGSPGVFVMRACERISASVRAGYSSALCKPSSSRASSTERLNGQHLL